jgi:hypothetical protein
MTHPVTDEVTRETGTGTDLWQVIAAPVVWSVHFVATYGLAAVHCAKAGRAAETGGAAIAILGLTAVALALIGIATLRLWKVRARSLTDNDFDFEHNTVEERHRFLSHVALMLCALSAVGVIFVAMPAVIIGTCR